MPFCQRTIEPSVLGRRAIPNETESDKSETSLTASNNALVGVLLQISSLVRHADDIFCDLAEECQKVFERTERINLKVAIIEEEVEKLNAKDVAIPVGDLQKFSVFDDHHVAKHGFDCDLFTPETRPQCVKDMFSLCAVTPVRLIRTCDQYRKDGWSGSRLFQLWPIVLREHKCRSPDLSLSRKSQVFSFEKSYKTPRIRERPKTIHDINDVIIQDLETNRLKDKDEEKYMSVSQPAITVQIDTSGRPFDQMQNFRRSLRKIDSGDRKRRRTVSGVPEDIIKDIRKFMHEKKNERENGQVEDKLKIYSFDDMDIREKTDTFDDSMVKYLDEIEGKMEERMEEERAYKDSKVLRFFPCRRARSLPRCIKFTQREAPSGDPNFNIYSRSSSTYASSLSIQSAISGSSRMSRSSKRSSIIGTKLKNFMSGVKDIKEKEFNIISDRPKSLDLDVIDLDVESDNSNLARNKMKSMPTGIYSETQSSQSNLSVGPGSYYNFANSTLPKIQARKYDFPWESLPKDWTSSVKLREICKRRKEERQSSSGNWSGTSYSSNRQSLESDTTKAAPEAPYNSEGSLGKDSGRGSPGPRRRSCRPREKSSGSDETSSSSTDTMDGMSRLTKQNILALEMMSGTLRRPRRMFDDEESSCYSVDQEGFYTSFHNDSGLRRSTTTLLEECRELSKISARHRKVEPVSLTVGFVEGQSFKKPEVNCTKNTPGRIPPPIPPRAEQHTDEESSGSDNKSELFNLSESTMVVPPMEFSSESDQEVVCRRVQNKTEISSKIYPSWCSVSPAGSDDESTIDGSNENLNQMDKNKKSKYEVYSYQRDKCEVVDFSLKDIIPERRNLNGSDISSINNDFTAVTLTDQSSFLDNKSFDSTILDRNGGISNKDADDFSYFSFDDTEFVDSNEQEYFMDHDLLGGTLPKRSHGTNNSLASEDNKHFNSWPRSQSFKSNNDLTPKSGILKNTDKSLGANRTPKTLNFDPVVNLFNPEMSESVEVPLSVLSSSSAENSPDTAIRAIQNNGISGSSYKLSIPLATPEEDEDDDTPLPMKYQPIITVTPKTRANDVINADESNSTNDIKMLHSGVDDSVDSANHSALRSVGSCSSLNSILSSCSNGQSTTLLSQDESCDLRSSTSSSYDHVSDSSRSTPDSLDSGSKSALKNSSSVDSGFGTPTFETVTIVTASVDTNTRNSSTKDTKSPFSTFLEPGDPLPPYPSCHKDSSDSYSSKVIDHSSRNQQTSTTFGAIRDHHPSSASRSATNIHHVKQPSQSRIEHKDISRPDASLSAAISINGRSGEHSSILPQPPPQPPRHSTPKLKTTTSFTSTNGIVPTSQSEMVEIKPSRARKSFPLSNNERNNPGSKHSILPSKPSISTGKTEVGGSNKSALRSGSYRVANTAVVKQPSPNMSSRNDSYRVANRADSYRIATTSPQLKPRPVLNEIQVDPSSRTDSYRVAIRSNMSNNVTVDANQRNMSYRVAVDDDEPTNTAISSRSSSSDLKSGRDARRMGISDVDQLKENSSVSQNRKSFSFLPSNLLGKNRTKEDNNSSSYIRFDPIFEDREDGSSLNSSKTPSLSSLTTVTSYFTSNSSSSVDSKCEKKSPENRTLYTKGLQPTKKPTDIKTNKSLFTSIKSSMKSKSSKSQNGDSDYVFESGV